MGPEAPTTIATNCHQTATKLPPTAAEDVAEAATKTTAKKSGKATAAAVESVSVEGKQDAESMVSRMPSRRPGRTRAATTETPPAAEGEEGVMTETPPAAEGEGGVAAAHSDPADDTRQTTEEGVPRPPASVARAAAPADQAARKRKKKPSITELQACQREFMRRHEWVEAVRAEATQYHSHVSQWFEGVSSGSLPVSTPPPRLPEGGILSVPMVSENAEYTPGPKPISEASLAELGDSQASAQAAEAHARRALHEDPHDARLFPYDWKTTRGYRATTRTTSTPTMSCSMLVRPSLGQRVDHSILRAADLPAAVRVRPVNADRPRGDMIYCTRMG